MQPKIEKLSSILYIQSTPYRFKKEQSPYDRGYLKVNFWMDALCTEHIDKDKEIVREFDTMTEKLKRWIQQQENSAYKEGMMQALKDIGYL